MYWKEAGKSFLQYSNICSKALRNVLKSDLRLQANKRDEQYVRMSTWSAGKPGEFKVMKEYVVPVVEAPVEK